MNEIDVIGLKAPAGMPWANCWKKGPPGCRWPRSGASRSAGSGRWLPGTRGQLAGDHRAAVHRVWQ